MYTIILGIGIGVALGVQTAVNSQLRNYVISPFLASLISFIIGCLFLAIALFVSGINQSINISFIQSQPLWLWLGGFLGVIGLTVNIMLFPKIGSVQTAVMPIIGQVIMSMMIDTFGWFKCTPTVFTIQRFSGIVLVFIGVFLAFVVQSLAVKKNKEVENKTKNVNLWRIIGVIGGMLMAMQAAINGQLGKALNSSVHAAFVSFFIGTLFLFVIILLKDRSFKNIVIPIKQNAPIWIWIGGILGGIYVLINVILVGIIGTGETIVLVLFGQVTGSIIIQQFGFIRCPVNKIAPIQIIGLIVLLSGVICIKML